MFFTTGGNVYHCSAHSLPIGEKTSLFTCIPMKEWEEVCAMTANLKAPTEKYIMFITKNGMIKKSEISEYNTNRNVGLRALTLGTDDTIVDVLFGNDERIGILTETGNFLMITTKDIRAIGRVAQGVRAIKLNPDDHVISAHIIPEQTTFIASVSGTGLFKKTAINEFTVQGKNTKGAKLQKLNDGDWMADFTPLTNESEILIASSRSCIKLTTNDIPIFGKGALGNKSIKLNSTDNVTRILKY